MEERLLALLSAQPAGLAVDDLKRMLQQVEGRGLCVRMAGACGAVGAGLQVI
jgi:hypothetical protein